jgi:hypothetical protein
MKFLSFFLFAKLIISSECPHCVSHVLINSLLGTFHIPDSMLCPCVHYSLILIRYKFPTPNPTARTLTQRAFLIQLFQVSVAKNGPREELNEYLEMNESLT